jgi:hypothetical protein
MIIPSISKKWGGTTSSLKNFYYGLTKIANVKYRIDPIKKVINENYN